MQNPLKTSGKRVRIEVIRFYPDTANDPSTVEDPGGLVSSVVHTATGKYSITLKDPPYNILGVFCSMSVVGDATDATAQGGVESGAVVVVKTKAGSSNTNFAADADTHVDVLLLLTDTVPEG